MQKVSKDNALSDRSRTMIKKILRIVESDSRTETLDAHQSQTLVRLFEPSREGDFIETGLSQKQQRATVFETIQQMPRIHLKRFFSALKVIIDPIISEESFVPEAGFHNEDEIEGRTGNKCFESLAVLKYTAMCAESLLGEQVRQNDKTGCIKGIQLHIVPEVYDVALGLHTVLLALHECGPPANGCKAAILSLCASWWISNAPHRENLIAQVLPLLVLDASDSTEFQKSHIKRLLQFKDAFRVIDFSNPSSDSLRTLLLRVASNPLCLKIPEGKKFLASLFRDPDLVPELHLAFRAQIPKASKTVLQAYGEIYHRAWREAEDACEVESLEAIEHQALQDLMHAAIHVSSNSMAKSILEVLQPLHADKKSDRVAALLHRLYSPILWRSLSAANPSVREKATIVLEKIFPLHDTAKDQMKASILRCSDALSCALRDMDVKVRVAGAIATSKICALYWEALPSDTIRMLLNCIVFEHASDGKSSAVRAAAVEAVGTILRTPQSHAVLRPLLPSLGNLIHDKSERVRLAVVKLLRLVKETPGIRFYHVVPVDHIVARFCEESRIHGNPRNSISKELTALMLNSYFPQGRKVSASDQMHRTLTFLSTDPNAAAVFYANLSDLLDDDAREKFVVMLLSCLVMAVSADESSGVEKGSKTKKRRRSPVHSGTVASLSASNTTLMAGIAETLCVVMKGLNISSSQGQSNEFLQIRFKEANIVNLLTHFERKSVGAGSPNGSKENQDCIRVSCAIMSCASFLPENAIDGLSECVETSLKNICERNVVVRSILPHLSLLVAWGLVEEVSFALTRSIDRAMGHTTPLELLSPPSGCRRDINKGHETAKTRSPKIKVPELSVKLACETLDEIIRGRSASGCMIREKIFGSEKATAIIGGTLSRGLLLAEHIMSCHPAVEHTFQKDELECLLFSCEGYGRFILHKAAYICNGRDTESEISSLIDWTSEKTLPILLNETDNRSSLHELDLSRISNASDTSITFGSPGFQSSPREQIPQTGARISSDLSSPATRTFSPQGLAHVVAKTLIQSSSIIYSESLVMGYDLGGEVSARAERWCDIFRLRNRSSDETFEASSRKELLPSFLRLAVQLYKSSQNFNLTRKLLVEFNEPLRESDVELCRKAAISILQLGSRHGSSCVQDLVDMFCLAMVDILENGATQHVFEIAHSSTEVWSSPKITLPSIFLTEISRNETFCTCMALKLILRVTSHRGALNSQTSFFAKCLSFLITGGNSRYTGQQMKEEFEKADLHQHDLGQIAQKLVEISS